MKSYEQCALLQCGAILYPTVYCDIQEAVSYFCCLPERDGLAAFPCTLAKMGEPEKCCITARQRASSGQI